MAFKYTSSVALPKEHGAYGFTLEPLLLALLAGFSWPGFLLACGSLLAFFAHQPIKILFNGNKTLRRPAYGFLLVYGLLTILFFSLYLRQVPLQTAYPFLAALAVMLFYLALDLMKYSRVMVIQILAPAAIALIAVSIVLADNWSYLQAWGLWLILAARFIPTPFYIRTRLHLERGKPANRLAAVASAILANLMILVLCFFRIIPWFALLPLTVLSARTLFGLSKYRRKTTVKKVGMLEFAYGLLLVLFSAAGYWIQY